MPTVVAPKKIPAVTQMPRALVAARAKVDAWAYAMAYVILQRQLRDHRSAA